AGDAGPRRRRTAVRRVHRPGGLPRRAGPARQAVPRILVSRHWPAARGGGAVRPRRDFGVNRQMDAVLETRSLCKSFGALTVAQSIDIRLRPGDRHALIGPNGAGKTTFVNMLMGALRPSSGRILLGGDDVTRAPQAQRVKRGLGRTFQINSLFRNLPVLDNVALAVAERRGMAPRMWRAAGSYQEIIEESTQLLATGECMTSISASSTMADALRLERVRAGYGQTVVLEDVDLVLRERGALAVLGRNGVGKTTLLATIMGHTTFHSGEILLSEKS